jgi:alanine dehydrogenase
MLVRNGHEILIESKAGENANFTDQQYSDAGAKIVYDVREIFQAEIILKVAALSQEEIEITDTRKIIFSSLHWRKHKSDYYRNLMRKKLTAFYFEGIQDNNGIYHIIRSMSEIAGNTAMMIASDLLSSTQYGQASIPGGFTGVEPTNVVIIGAGTVGEFACRTALGMGAEVKVFDNSVNKLRRLQEIQQHRFYTSVIQPKRLAKALEQADIVIAALRPVNGITPVVATKEMVQNMKKGAVIIDLSIDHGGCFETSEETSHHQPVFTKYGVTHYCVPNMPSKTPRTASIALSNFFAPILQSVSEKGGIDGMLRSHRGLRNGVYLYKGIITDKNIAGKFQFNYQNIDLLIAAFNE